MRYIIATEKTKTAWTIVYIGNDKKCFLCIDAMVLQFDGCIIVENTITTA